MSQMDIVGSNRGEFSLREQSEQMKQVKWSNQMRDRQPAISEFLHQLFAVCSSWKSGLNDISNLLGWLLSLLVELIPIKSSHPTVEITKGNQQASIGYEDMNPNEKEEDQEERESSFSKIETQEENDEGHPSVISDSKLPSNDLDQAEMSLDNQMLSESTNYKDEGSDFCGRPVSSENFERLRLDTSEDLIVCQLQRGSTLAAMRLFRDLTSTNLRETSADSSCRPSETGSEISNFDPEEASRGHVGGIHDSESPPTFRRRTLVCSMSPTNSEPKSGRSTSQSSSSGVADCEPQFVYPLEQEEMQNCRTAFRRNRQLLEAKQRDSIKLSEVPTLQRHIGRLEFNSEPLHICSFCNKKVYPVDLLELDFTKAKLNIHRSCFKCQSCSTLLRLETYSALDSKLYCPAHIRRISPSLGLPSSK